MRVRRKSLGPSVSVRRVPSKRYKSARALAKAFGSAVFEPTWWPEDSGRVVYRLDRWPSHVGYRIEATRRDGTPIWIVGAPENPRARLADEDWHQLPDLEGLVSTSGDHVHAVVQREQLTIQLTGYASEAEVVRAVRSFRRVTAG